MAKFNVRGDEDKTAVGREKFRHSQKRTITGNELRKSGTLRNGLVVALEGNYYDVRISENGKTIEARRAGKIITDNGASQIIAIGDKVVIEIDEESENLASIVEVKKRESRYCRLSIYGGKEDVVAANIDNVLITCSAENPHYNKRMIDRMLIAATVGGVAPGICINKSELADEEEIADDLASYADINIPVFIISCYNNKNIDELSDFLSGKTTALAGMSGVGKSSIINLLSKNFNQSVSEVSRKTGKGRHTTSAAIMTYVNENTSLIDTPGLREFGIVGLHQDELQAYFPEFMKFNEKCRFIPCSHTHEPGCAVKDAVFEGEIDADRYESYLNIFDSLEK